MSINYQRTTDYKFLNLLKNLKTWKLDKFPVTYGPNGVPVMPEPAALLDGANLVSSNRKDLPPRGEGDRHAVLLDLDVPAFLIPSSTPGHSHLYINKALEQDKYFKLLDVLAECGILEQGYVDASKSQGGTFLRLPWVKKGDENR